MKPFSFDSEAEVRRLAKAGEMYSTEYGQLNRDIVSNYDLETILRHATELRLERASCVMMGLGDGASTRSLAKHVARLTVLEGSAELVKIFSAEAPSNMTLTHTLFEAYESTTRHDVVIATHVLEHVENPVEVLRRARTWLKPGGRVFASVPNSTSLHRRIGVKLGLLETEKSLHALDLKIGHRRVYSIDEFRANLTHVGFEVVKLGGFMLKLVSQAQMKEWPRGLLDAIYDVSLEVEPEICSNLYAICKNSSPAAP